MLGSIVPGPFDFAGRFGPANETVAPEHLAVCVVYGDDGKIAFGSYVVYPSADRHGKSRSFAVTHIGDRTRVARTYPFRSGEFADKFIWP